MELFLMRHGIAGPGTPPAMVDEDRRLTPEGKRRIRLIAMRLRSLRITFDLILSSPLVRARQTAAIVAKELGIDAVETTPSLSPGRSPDDILRLLRTLAPCPDALLLIGHEPLLHESASFLLSGKKDLQIVLKKGGLIKIVMEPPFGPPGATLDLLLSPRVLLRK